MAIPVLRNILTKLSIARCKFQTFRHFSYMGAFVGFGMAATVVGAFAIWVTAGGTMISDGAAQDHVLSRIRALQERLDL